MRGWRVGWEAARSRGLAAQSELRARRREEEEQREREELEKKAVGLRSLSFLLPRARSCLVLARSVLLKPVSWCSNGRRHARVVRRGPVSCCHGS